MTESEDFPDRGEIFIKFMISVKPSISDGLLGYEYFIVSIRNIQITLESLFVIETKQFIVINKKS